MSTRRLSLGGLGTICHCLALLLLLLHLLLLSVLLI